MFFEPSSNFSNGFIYKMKLIQSYGAKQDKKKTCIIFFTANTERKSLSYLTHREVRVSEMRFKCISVLLKDI